MSILWTNHGRCKWSGKLGLVLIIAWLLAIFLSISHIFKSSTISVSQLKKNFKNDEDRLMQITNNFQILKKQNSVLRNIIVGNSPESIPGNHLGKIVEKIRKESVYYDLFNREEVINGNYNQPSLQYEETRRKIRNDVQEMWYFINGELNKIKKSLDKYNTYNDLSATFNLVNEYKKSLITNIDKIYQIDGYTKWREKEANDLSSLVQQRFRSLQNPINCNTAKKLICNINKGCGFGCQIHHLVYCFLVAYGTERTLILKSKGWRYQKEGWESVFLPLSDTCLSPNGKTHANWPSDESKQVIILPIVDNIYPKPIYQPPSVPADLAQRLSKMHGYPLVWWVGQVLKYLMRPNNNTKELLDNKRQKIKFSNPIVGVHIRRTDKVGTEAAFHDIEEYMIRVHQYFESLEKTPKIKRIFLASDDPKVITAAKQRYVEYEIIADIDIAQTASVSRRYSNLSLQGIIIDIYFLSRCDYLVCTFSSQVCRVAYELMQTHFPDAYNRFSSLDDIYYYGGQNPHPQIVTINHVPKREGEIELKINDEIEVYGNHWDGYSKGRNLRTGMIGLFPSFKIKNPVKAVVFPKYQHLRINKNLS
ncbi:alpha-(1,6)-fucosyltransferase isoform X2 [Nasonia vitripennis]|nr:alpha-(1,6)-fucosyltransferase isoform X2 [Nasonia vitripennis]XP_031786081.1 alpha-(1,6)-fucosyltransferase isoform X2 [Nasonia vitripennis]XP_031786082.1 alpha-(1,6)-fucosyltransferase isoform X2 [Nasonia vitripennis]XP_032457979.1 alpha-(1,6)-fucosyltransferase isoform X2 [Nasonia vitripennis]XP_032457980.1 alpha-(1,6)-fucosyltransferase isoform X2 [Nasonia vitripennis]XP_032457981.1 alpha-(1,6)-fucosyltransferase isoform X2 [Nasonia vitripennis]XP_032457982.1 alpha-(1,6)-fucosyltransfe